MSLHCGIDEAGRGPVLGPLVVCGVAIERARHGRLARLGLRDSKALSPAQRERLAAEIRATGARVHLEIHQAPAVDAATALHELNGLETAAMTRIVRALAPARVWVDGLTNRPGAFGRRLEELARPLRVRVVSESRADERYPLVQAASILAKVARDAAIAALARVHGEIGSGYPGDPKTRAFLRRCAEAGTFPPFVRQSWGTVARLTVRPAADAA
ncbi:MAG: ribonuclease HII [Candidatus Coatesbacteria bacterium]